MNDLPTELLNFCDRCNRQIGLHDGGLCGGCADDEWDRWLDRHDDIGVDE